MIRPLAFLLLPLFLHTSVGAELAWTEAPCSRPPSSSRDAVGDLERWAKRLKRSQSPPSVAEARELDEILSEMTGLLARDSKRGEAADLALLELIRVAEQVARIPGYGPTAPSATPFLRGQAALRARLRGPHGKESAENLTRVLLGKRDYPGATRRFAALALGDAKPPGTLSALLRVVQDEDAHVAQTAQAALVGWDDARVHLVFLDLLERRQGTRAAAEHLKIMGSDLGPQALDRLRDLVGRLYVSDDWRDAARAQAVVGALDTVRSAPLLIEALATWGRRAESGRGSRRIIEEIVVELRRLSGRNLGREPAPWHRWWGDVLSGDILLPEAALARGTPMTRATFFGLRLASDRVLFLVDRSGSMGEDFGTGGQTRYEEAVDQLFRFLQSSGPTTRFGLALFHDGADIWRAGHLVEATDAAQKQARRWLTGKRPKGGTELRKGLFKALGGSPEGDVAANRLEADTLVVLCDGATAGGPAWVADWIERTGEDLQLVIHGIQIGAFGDDTLEALAKGTGGQFVRIQR